MPQSPGTEHYRPRGLGHNFASCFICGGPKRGISDMSALVLAQSAGERIVAMFEAIGANAWLDYRESQPNWIQVKVGACPEHEPNLRLLFELTRYTHMISLDVLNLVMPRKEAVLQES